MSDQEPLENIGLAAWINAVSPDSIYIKGVRIRDITLGHATTIQRYELNEIETAADLINVIRVCSKSYKDGLDYIDTLFWNWRLLFRPVLLWKHLKTRLSNWWLYQKIKGNEQETKNLFVDYLEYRTMLPPVGQVAANPRNIPELGIPFLGQLRGNCVVYGGYDPDKVMDAGFLQLAYDFMVIVGISPDNEQDRAIGEVLRGLPTPEDRTREALDTFRKTED